MLLKTIFFLLISILLPLSLFAHGSHGNGIMAGFTHPIFGVDHAIAIFGAGFLAYQLNNSKWYLYFMPFIIAMIIGGFLGVDKEATVVVEKTIALSVLVIGLFIAFYKKINFIIILISFAIFGFFHGFAHGAEMPPAMNKAVYITGYSLGTLLMATIGMLIGKILNTKNNFDRNALFISGFIVGFGIMILIS